MSSLELVWNTANSQQSHLVNAPEQVLIGRNPACQITFADATVSGYHAQVFEYQSLFYINNLSKKNPAKLNNIKLADQPKQLAQGDIILVGPYTVRVASINLKKTAYTERLILCPTCNRYIEQNRLACPYDGTHLASSKTVEFRG